MTEKIKKIETPTVKKNTYILECECGSKATFEVEGRPTKYTLISIGEKFGIFPLKCAKCGSEHGPDKLKWLK